MDITVPEAPVHSHRPAISKINSVSPLASPRGATAAGRYCTLPLRRDDKGLTLQVRGRREKGRRQSPVGVSKKSQTEKNSREPRALFRRPEFGHIITFIPMEKTALILRTRLPR